MRQVLIDHVRAAGAMKRGGQNQRVDWDTDIIVNSGGSGNQVRMLEIDRALEAVCLKAMSLKLEDRYGSCRALAEDIERWMADEPVSAYCGPWHDRARRWSRKHRALVTSAAAVVVLGLIGSVGFTAVVTAKNRALAEQSQRAEAREQMAIEAVKRFRDVVVEEPVLKNSPALDELRK